MRQTHTRPAPEGKSNCDFNHQAKLSSGPVLPICMLKTTCERGWWLVWVGSFWFAHLPSLLMRGEDDKTRYPPATRGLLRIRKAPLDSCGPRLAPCGSPKRIQAPLGFVEPRLLFPCVAREALLGPVSALEADICTYCDSCPFPLKSRCYNRMSTLLRFCCTQQYATARNSTQQYATVRNSTQQYATVRNSTQQ